MLKETHIDGARVLTPPAELDIASAAHFVTDVVDSLTDGDSRLVLDFSDVRLIDSAGIGGLLSAERRVRALGAELVVANASPHVRRVFEITGVGRSLTIQ